MAVGKHCTYIYPVCVLDSERIFTQFVYQTVNVYLPSLCTRHCTYIYPVCVPDSKRIFTQFVYQTLNVYLPDLCTRQ